MQDQITRRSLIKSTVAGSAIGSVVLGSKLFGFIADQCGITPPQTEGPFYPVKLPLDKDADLTRFQGQTGLPEGEVIEIYGVVQDETCKPIAKALVEIWQACASGRYNHPGDTSGLKLDPNFQYYGRAITDKDGKYFFRTIRPGHYPAEPGWVRPPHIHFKVFARGYHDLTSQLYFSGKSIGGELGKLIDELNQKDRILQAVPASERESVIVDLSEGAAIRRGRFDVTVIKA